jgi:hypothetical protein
MPKAEFTKKELHEIRDIAIRMYASENPGSTLQDAFRFRMIAEATYSFLKGKGLIKDEHVSSKPDNEG